MEPQTPKRSTSGRVVIGLAILVVGVAALLDSLAVDVPWAIVLPAAVILIGLVLLLNPRSEATGGWVIVGGVMTVVLLVGSFSGFSFGSFDVGSAANTEQAVFVVAEPIQRIVLSIHAGTVEIVVGDTDQVEVERQLRFDDERPEVDHSVDGEVLLIEAKCRSGFFSFGSSCSVDHFLRVPAAVDLEIDSGAGSVTVTGTDGSVRVDTASGGIELIDLSGRVTADSGSGGIVMQRLSGTTDVQTGSGGVRGNGLTVPQLVADTGSGSIDVSFSTSPEDLNLEAGSGSVTITVPAGSYDLDLDTGSGGTESAGITDDASSARSIRVRTGSGSIRINGE